MFFIHYGNAESQKKFCDPFSKHGKKTSKGVSVIVLDLSDSVFTATENFRLIPGKKLCPRYFKQAKDFLKDGNSEPYGEPEMICDSHFNPINDDYNLNIQVTHRKVINALADASVISPIENINRLSKERRLNVFEKVIDSVKRNVMTESDGSPNLKLEDYSLLMTELRDKVKPILCSSLHFYSSSFITQILIIIACIIKIHLSSSHKEKYSLLTLAPACWTQALAFIFWRLFACLC